MLDNNVICYKGVQRVYRNAIVRFLREKMKKLFPDDYRDKIKKPFKNDEWENIEKNAALSRETCELNSQVMDEFDLLSVNHFFNLFDLYYETLCPEGGNFKKKQKQALLSWMKTIKNLRDPLSHPSEEDFSFEDSFLLLDCARRVLLSLDLERAAKEIRELQNNLSGKPAFMDAEQEPLEGWLPSRESIVIKFVGRGDLLAELWDWLRDPVSRRWALSGEGGKGKSALAYEFAVKTKISAPQPFQAVFWLSAKTKKFEEGSVKQIDNPEFFDLDSALVCLLSFFGWIDQIQEPLETKRKTVLELLNSFPALIVVDDIDSVDTENEEVIEFFSLQVPNTKSKVLFTSRRRIFGMGSSTTHIAGFNEIDAKEYILSRCELMELSEDLFNPELCKEIWKTTEGSPLYIEDLMRLASVMPVRDALKHWREKGGAVARKYALERECESLTLNAKKILFAASISSGPVSFAELGSILTLNFEELTGALQELQRLFLMPKPKLIEGEQRFDIAVNTKMLIRDVYGSSDIYNRIKTDYKAISGEMPNIGSKVIAPLIRQAVFLLKSSKYNDAERLLVSALEKYNNNSDLNGFLGWIYKNWQPPRLTDARERFQRAYQLKCMNEKMYMQWSKMEATQDEWTKSAEAAEKGLKLLPENRELLYLAGYARVRLGKEFVRSLQREKAIKEFEKAKDYSLKALKDPAQLEIGERSLNAAVYRNLVLSCEHIDKKGMVNYFNTWKTEHPDDPNVTSERLRLSRKFPEFF